MHNRTKWIVAGVVLAATAGGAYAADNFRRHGEGERQRIGQMMFERFDANSDSAVTVEELTAMIAQRFSAGDANADGSLTKAEAVTAIETQTEFQRARRHAGRIADRMFERLDLNEDGQVALAEIENRSKKLFALADFNDDGKVETAELRRMAPRGHHRWREGGRGFGRD